MVLAYSPQISWPLPAPAERCHSPLLEAEVKECYSTASASSCKQTQPTALQSCLDLCRAVSPAPVLRPARATSWAFVLAQPPALPSHRGAGQYLTHIISHPTFPAIRDSLLLPCPKMQKQSPIENREQKRSFPTHMNSSPRTHTSAQRPNSSDTDKKLPPGSLRRKKRKQMETRLEECVVLLSPSFPQRSQQRCGFPPGNGDSPCSKRCSCKCRERNSTHFCCRVCCEGLKELTVIHTFTKLQNTSNKAGSQRALFAYRMRRCALFLHNTAFLGLSKPPPASLSKVLWLRHCLREMCKSRRLKSGMQAAVLRWPFTEPLLTC